MPSIIVERFYSPKTYLEFYRIPHEDIISGKILTHVKCFSENRFNKIAVFEDNYGFKPSKNDSKLPLISSSFVKDFGRLSGIGFILNNIDLDFLHFDNVQNVELLTLALKQKKRKISIDHLLNLAYVNLGKTDELTIQKSMSTLHEARIQSHEINNIDFSMLPNLLNISIVCPKHKMSETNIDALKSLKGLEIMGNGKIDLSFLESLPDLEALVLRGGFLDVNSLPDCKKIKKLKWIQIFGLPTITNFSEFGNLKNLESIYIDYNKKINVESLMPLLQLEKLIRIGGFTHLPTSDIKTVKVMFNHIWDDKIGADTFRI